MRNQCVIVPTLPLLVNAIAATGGSGNPANAGFQREVDAAIVNLGRAHQAGVPLAPGSESGWSPVPYGQWHARELQIFVDDLGMSPLQAIHAGTLGATRLFKRFGADIGRLEPGRYADLIVIDGDPGEDIALLQKPSRFDWIFKSGRPVDRTPPAPRRRMHYERHKMFLDGFYQYDEDEGRGVLRR